MSNFKFQPQKSGLAAMLEAQRLEKERIEAERLRLLNQGLPQDTTNPTNSSGTTSLAKDFSFKNAAEASERIRIIFDDSGSMGGEKIQDAIMGCEEFMRNCIPNSTAVSIHAMNYTDTKITDLTTNLPALAVLAQGIYSQGGTPLFKTLKTAQSSAPKATRYIVFSDGEPNTSDKSYKEECINTAVNAKTPVDTVLIVESYENNDSLKDSQAYILLKELADKTGGYFLVFDRNKVDFKHAFGFLAPVQRLALSDGSFRTKLEEGKV